MGGNDDMKFKKATIILVALLTAVFMASSAMAYILNSRSEEMTANSTCDFAGTITLTFTLQDYTIIQNYLATNNAVLIRVSLSGTDFAAGSDVPLLCKDIKGTVTANGAQGVAIPHSGQLTALQTAAVEVSDLNATAGADVTAYVWGQDGLQYFEIYITAIEAADDWADQDALPWIRVGLYQELLDAGDGDTTEICADVHDFDGLAKLTVSIDNTPSDLTTTTSDNQIGHFLVENFTLADCTKDELVYCPSDDTIELCPISGTGQSVTCPTYDYCFTIEGDFPKDNAISLIIRSNGATDGANTQQGVYLRSIVFRNEIGDVIATNNSFYYEAGGSPEVTPDVCDLNGDTITYVEAEKFVTEIDATAITGTGNDKLQVCITYMVDPLVAQAGTDVRFWVEAETLPCGSLFTGVRTAAALIECGTEPSCIYFPYVFSGIKSWGWQCGLAITNLSAAVPAADMEVTMTLTDSTGAKFTYTKTDFDKVVNAFFLDDILANFSGTPAPGPAWLLVQANFTVDGYEFVTDGNFGGSTLARALQSCSSVHPTP